MSRRVPTVNESLLYDLSSDSWTGKKTIRISHNGEALDQGRQRILQAIKEVQAMRHSRLAGLRGRITELETEFAAFKFTTLEISEVSGRAASDMRPEPPNAGAGERINNLTARVVALEGRA